MPAPDLVAMVIELCALMPTHISNHMGRAVQHFGLSVLGRCNPQLEKDNHKENEVKAFTASGLMKHQGLLFGNINVGDSVWIRLTGLSREVNTALLAFHYNTACKLSDGDDEIIEFNRLPWKIHDVHIDEHPWAGSSTYQQLIERHKSGQLTDKISLCFFAPTTFRSQGNNMPLPLPSLVFGSLLSRWIAFTSHRLRDLPQDQLDAFIAHHLRICHQKTETQLIRGKNGGKEIGFSGEVTYELFRKSDYLLKHDPQLENLIRSEYKWFVRTMSLLANFAFYSGVGRKTTTGMGSVK